MNQNHHRADRAFVISGVVSAIAHASLLCLFVLMLLPAGKREDPVNLELVIEETVGAELVVFDVTIADPEDEDEPEMVDVIGDMSEASLEIVSPLVHLAAGAEGSGQHHANAGAQQGSGGGQGRVSFFGTEAVGDHFVYILDTSGSMNAGKGRRLQRAIDELLRSIDQLREDQFFYVVLFASSTRRVFDSPVPLFPDEMIQATRENKARLRAWIEGVRPKGGTHPQEALRISLGMNPSAVFFLSDGEFNKPRKGGLLDAAELEAHEVVARSAAGNTPIHTIAFEDPDSKTNLDRISLLTGGEFRFVPGPVTGRERARVVSDDRKERRAENWIKIASSVSETDAQRYYLKVMRDYPGTNAAKKARRLHTEYLISRATGG